MKLQNKLNAKGEVFVTLKKEDGSTEVIEHHNLIVDTGLQRIIGCFLGTASGGPTEIHAGTGTTWPIASDTALETEIASTPILSITQTGAGNVLEITGMFGIFEAVGIITELGLFCDDGTMFSRTVFDNGLEKCDLDELYVTWIITVAGF